MYTYLPKKEWKKTFWTFMLLVCSPWSETNIHVFLQHQQHNRPSWISQNNFSEKNYKALTRHLLVISTLPTRGTYEIRAPVSHSLHSHKYTVSNNKDIKFFIYMQSAFLHYVYNTWPSVTVAVKLVRFNIKMILAALMSSFSCILGRVDTQDEKARRKLFTKHWTTIKTKHGHIFTAVII